MPETLLDPIRRAADDTIMSHHDSPKSKPAESRKAELEELFQQWDDRDPAAAEPGARQARLKLLSYGVRARAVVSVVIIAVTAFVMYHSQRSFFYALQSGDPVALGDLRERWANGEHTFHGESGTHVSAESMIVSRSVSGARCEGEERLFFCPLYDIVVTTCRDLPPPPSHRLGWVQVDERLGSLVRDKKIFAEDLSISFDASGRLVRGDDVSEQERIALKYYAQRLKRDWSELWLLVDGDTPSDNRLALVLWILCTLAPLISLFFLFRAVRLQRRARAARF